MERVIGGGSLETSLTERLAIVEYALRHGWTTPETAQRIGCTERSIIRYRARLNGSKTAVSTAGR